MRSNVIFHSLSPTFSFAFVQAMATSQFLVLMPWTTTKLVPKALNYCLEMVEDPIMVHLVGRAKLVDLVMFSPLGWQQGVIFSPLQLCP